MTIQQLLSPLRRADTDYNMIEDGDKIAVGVSGGKDSLTLLALLKAYQRFSPHKFDLIGVTIDIGLKENAYLPVSEYCEQLEIPYIVEKTEIGKIVFEERKEKNPCSLCSKMRRGALNNKLNELGYNKLALGHHRDDVVETFLLSLIHEGRLSTFSPISYMSRSKITLIRPMIYIEERDIIPFASTLPVVVNPCPANKHTEREAMKDLLKDLRHNYHDISDNIANALQNPTRNNLWDKALDTYNNEKPKD